MGGQVSTAEKADLDNWFVRQVLPHETVRTRFLLRNWRAADEVPDILQEVYVRIYEAATQKRPNAVKPFLFAAARNLMIDRVRHMNVVSIEAVADFDNLIVEDENPSPEMQALARDELNQLRKALETLPPW